MEDGRRVRRAWSRFAAWYRRWPRACRWVPPVLWMALIFYLSAQPSLPSAPDSLLDAILKKAAHMAEYAVLYLLLWQALGPRSAALAWLLSLLYAASDEFHQTFVPGRHGWVVDVIVDGVGASSAALVAWLLRRRRRQ